MENVPLDGMAIHGLDRLPIVDVLYPELGIAICYDGSQSVPRRDRALVEGLRAISQRQTGVALVVIKDGMEPHNPAWAELRGALSAAARRVAQQPGNQAVKLDLLPRIAAAKATCQRLLAGLPSMRLEGGSRSQIGVYQRRGPGQPVTRAGAPPSLRERWQAFEQKHLDGLGTILASVLGILRVVALFLAVLFAVNLVSFLVANFLELRGPMAYNYVPDTKVAFADVVAPYPDYLRSVLQGDFGMMRQNELRGMLFSQQVVPIGELVLDRLPRSLVLLGVAMLGAIVVGITAGFLSVNYKTQQTNPLALILSLAGFSMPGFYMGILILYLMIWLAMHYGRGMFFLPTTGFGLDAHLILPTLALAARPTAEIARLTAELLREELPKDYINVARAKGLTERAVITRHAFRNVLAAVVNAMSNSWSYVIGSLVIIERVFAWGGIGEALIDSVTFSQFAGSTFNPALVATLASSLALLWLLANLITSTIARAVDPRLRRAQGGAA